MELTLKQKRFIENYANPASDTYSNATRSYLKAGYKNTGNVMQCACRCLHNVKVSEQIASYTAENKQKTDISRDYLIDKLKNIIEKPKTTDRDIVSSASLIADLCGFKRESAPNREKLAEIQQRTAKELEYLRKVVVNQTDRQAKTDTQPAITDTHEIRLSRVG